MKISNEHNLVEPPDDAEKRYGIRVSFVESDPFRRLLSQQRETLYWFDDAAERDAALEDMSSRHRYSRIGDLPTVRCEPIER